MDFKIFVYFISKIETYYIVYRIYPQNIVAYERIYWRI